MKRAVIEYLEVQIAGLVGAGLYEDAAWHLTTLNLLETK